MSVPAPVDPPGSPAAAEPSGGRSLAPRLSEPRARQRHGRLVISYPGWVPVLWCGLALIGFGYAIASASAGHRAEATFIGLGMGAIAAFVASFALRPVVVADPSGISLLPVFASRMAFRWDEVTALGVRESRRARGRGASLAVFATEDREVTVDGLWVGLTPANLAIIERQLAAFVSATDLTRAPIGFAPEPDPW